MGGQRWSMSGGTIRLTIASASTPVVGSERAVTDRVSIDATDAAVTGLTVKGNTSMSSFAWQAGGGVTYALNKQVTLDLGYRFFALQQVTTSLTLTGLGPTPLVLSTRHSLYRQRTASIGANL